MSKYDQQSDSGYRNPSHNWASTESLHRARRDLIPVGNTSLRRYSMARGSANLCLHPDPLNVGQSSDFLNAHPALPLKLVSLVHEPQLWTSTRPDNSHSSDPTAPDTHGHHRPHISRCLNLMPHDRNQYFGKEKAHRASLPSTRIRHFRPCRRRNPLTN